MHHSSGEDDFPYMPRPRENRVPRRHNNVFDDMPLFGDPTWRIDILVLNWISPILMAMLTWRDI